MIVLRNINVGAATTRTELGNYYLRYEIKNNVSICYHFKFQVWKKRKKI